MVRFHPLPLLRNRAVAGVLRARRGIVACGARRVRHRLFNAAARRGLLRAYRRQEGPAAHDAAVRRSHDGRDVRDGPAADVRANRTGGGGAADPAPVCDGVFGRRRIYRRRRLSARRCADPSSRADRFLRFRRERSGGTVGGRRVRGDGRLDERGGSFQLGLAYPVLRRRRPGRVGVDCPLDDGRKSGVSPPGSRADRSRQPPSPQPRQPSRRDRASVRDFGAWGRSLITSASPTFRRS